jgi:hypothetical protein
MRQVGACVERDDTYLACVSMGRDSKLQGAPVSSIKTFFSCLAGFAVLISPLAAVAASATCHAPEIGTSGAPLVSPPLGAVVVGTGRLQFYSAPSSRCPIAGVFVIPRDEVIIHAQTDDGWSSVDYSNANTDVSGWVRSGRLKTTGTEGPTQ